MRHAVSEWPSAAGRRFSDGYHEAQFDSVVPAIAEFARNAD